MQRTFILSALCAGLLAAAAAGCGGNQGCLDYAKTVCTRNIQCSSFSTLYYGPNFDICQTQTARTCELSTKAPDSNFSQAAASACAQALAAASCDDVLAGNYPAECRPAGNRANGGSCADAFQCQSLFCNRPTSHDCGTCTPLPKLNEACTSDGYCDYGLQCASGTCVAYRELGESCDNNLYCKPTLACMNATCQQPMLGGACNQPYECSDSQLQYCDASTLTCQPYPLTIAKVGESCGVATDGVVACQPAAYCRTMGSSAFGVCTMLPTEGQPCAGTSNNLCASPTTCISGTCQIFDRNSCG